MNYDRPELLDRLASEYVFGTLAGGARRRFEQLRRQLPAADAAVSAWEQRLAPLALPIPPVTPSPALWDAIDRRTGGVAGTRDAAARSVAAGRSWLAWLTPVLGVAFGVLATLGVVRMYPDAVFDYEQFALKQGVLPQSYVGLLTDSDGVPAVLASSTRHGTVMTAKILKPLDVPAGKVLQLWALPRDGAPFPLGVIPAQGQGSFTMRDTSEQLLANVPRLAVSIEDAPAAPGAVPGPFILSGHCVKLWEPPRK